MVRIALGFGVAGGLLLIFSFTFPAEFAAQTRQLRRWFMVSALIMLSVCIIAFVIAITARFLTGS